jgi:Fe-S cluster assembly iron-binding protein IscA
VSNATRAITIRELPPRRPLRTAPRRLQGRQPPLVVTDRALGELDNLLSKQRGRASQSLGLVLELDGQIGLVLDEPGEDDNLFIWNAHTVLFVTRSVAVRLAGHVLDYSSSSGKERFTLLPGPSDLDG